VGDLTGEEILVQAAQQAHEAGARHILLDMTEVPYVSSSGLRGLHALWMMFRQDLSPEGDQAVKQGITGGSYKSPQVKLLKPSKNALKALSLSGYDMFLEIHHALEEAIDSFQPSQA
jgi:hypothetical protein